MEGGKRREDNFRRTRQGQEGLLTSLSEMFGGIRAWTNTWGNSGTPARFTGATSGVEAVVEAGTMAGTDKARPRGATRERTVEAREGVGDAGAVCQAGGGGAPKTESNPMG